MLIVRVLLESVTCDGRRRSREEQFFIKPPSPVMFCTAGVSTGGKHCTQA